MVTYYGKGTLKISTDGGETWQAVSGSQFEIVHDESGEAKEIEVPTYSVLLPLRVMTCDATMGPDWVKKIAALLSQHLVLPSVSYEPPKKKKAQWKQSPLSRFSR